MKPSRGTCTADLDLAVACFDITFFCRYVYQSEKRYNDNDGLIFTPENQPFKAVGLNGIFKWKWPNLQTVDFLLRVEERTNKFGNISKDFVLYLQGNGGLLIKFQKAKFPNDIRKRIWRILEERDSKEVSLFERRYLIIAL